MVEDLKKEIPNTHLHPFIHKHQFYRRDKWRHHIFGHTEKFLVKLIDHKDFISKFDGKMFWHAMTYH